jgi:hypothetical protein
MEADAIFDRLIGVLIAQGSASRRRLCLAVTISGVLLISVVQCPNALAAWGAGVEATLPANANSTQGVAVSSVSCASAGNCGAAGFYSTNDSGQTQGEVFVVSETKGTWGTAQEIPGTAALNAGGEAALGSLSCAPAGTCGAGGYYTDGSGHRQAFAVSEPS